VDVLEVGDEDEDSMDAYTKSMARFKTKNRSSPLELHNAVCKEKSLIRTRSTEAS
jgi:hypothetical protein